MYVKKDGNNLITQDISEVIYSKMQLDPKEIFVEVGSKDGKIVGSKMFATVIAVVHKTKVIQFQNQYELVIPWNDNQFGAVPRSAKFLDIEDQDGY